MLPGAHRLLIVVLGSCLAMACQRTPSPAGSAAKVQSAAVVPKPPALPEAPTDDGRWQLLQLDVKVETTQDQQVHGVDTGVLTKAVRKILSDHPQIAAMQDRPLQTIGLRAAMMVTVAWQILDLQGEPRLASAPAQAGTVLLSVVAHAERPIPHAQSQVAERTLIVSLPLPQERAEHLAEFLQERSVDAIKTAVGDALSELWARTLTDERILSLLSDTQTWRKVCAAREAGERKLTKTRPLLEKAAKDSRRDLSAVAAAALGRLGDPASIEVLQHCIGSSHPETVDAALEALLDIGTPAAVAVVRDVAEHNEMEVIRQRAQALLQGRDGQPASAHGRP